MFRNINLLLSVLLFSKIHLFSEPHFQGRSQCFGETISQIDDSFSTKSCRVLGGR